ncbi:MAG: phosphatase PAP2 family protein [Acidobacteria bacterium]|nr:phosphatase PAP2 family protein [Acidobacteriota bacterium]MCA1610317.1 phosphatase PAP2 family protein [Acidobacteriota bacterium]MCA1617284.1 phosphatase PAP2 family protein [Acidobacteriota bacterium]
MTSLREQLVGLDRRATLEVRRLHGPVRDRFLRRVSFLGGPRFMISATIAVAAVLIAFGHGRLAAVFGGAVLGGRALSPLLKWRFRRARPDLWPALETEKTHSFPSTHSTMGVVFFGGLSTVVFRLTPHPAWRAAILIVSVIAIAAVAFSRVYLGAHWLSDVAGGVALGLLWLFLWTLACRPFLDRPATPPRGRARVLLLPLADSSTDRRANGHSPRFFANIRPRAA